MKNLIVTAFVGLTISASGFATEANSSNIYVGVGRMKTESSFNYEEHALNSNFISLGYNVTENLSAEFQFSKSKTSFQNSYQTSQSNDIAPLVINTERSLKTVALFAAYRTSGDFYGKVKAGYMKETIFDKSSDAWGWQPIVEETEESSSQITGGVGAGYKFGHARIELEYTTSNGDLDLDYTSLQFIWGF